MSDGSGWTLWPTFEMPSRVVGGFERCCVVDGPIVPPGETVEVVRADAHRGAVKTLERIRDHADSAEAAAMLAQAELDRIKGDRMNPVEHCPECEAAWERGHKAGRAFQVAQGTDNWKAMHGALTVENERLDDQLVGAMEALGKAYRQLSNMHPADVPNRAAHNQRWADEARETLRAAIGGR